jgi:hypothetical protein
VFFAESTAEHRKGAFFMTYATFGSTNLAAIAAEQQSISARAAKN